MEQQTSSWHEWRSQGIGASDAPIIMGVSPWSTPYQLWQEKRGVLRVKSDGNWATDRGNRLEPKARASYEFKVGFLSPPTLVVNQVYPFIRASLDGYNAQFRRILEIKCPGKADHAKAISGEVPEKYFPQLQHQLLATGQAIQNDYYSYDGESGVLVICDPDSSYQRLLLEKLQEFWGWVQDGTPPPLTDKDRRRIAKAEKLYNGVLPKTEEI